MASDERTLHLLLDAMKLKHLHRSGWKRAGAPDESVGEHSFGVAMAALALAKMESLEEKEEHLLLKAAILHDLHEARLGDLTPQEKSRQAPDERGTEAQMVQGTHLEGELPFSLPPKAALLLSDADGLDMLLRAIENANGGNLRMGQFISSALQAIRSDSGKRLAGLALKRLKR
ncbi:MAG: HD domain-containing protein [Candidatus Micrarchaeota archaeon]|nr:HD domain-containing protein [Candidatus Micrarchaeota archaeon]